MSKPIYAILGIFVVSVMFILIFLPNSANAHLMFQQVDIEIDGTFTGDGRDLVVDSSGNVYVADDTNHRVLKFNSAGTFQGWLGKCTSGSNCDIGNQRSNGFSCTTATCPGLGAGSSDGQFDRAIGIGIDNSDNIYIAELGNDRFQKFDSSGNHLLTFGIFGTNPGEFIGPWDVAIDDSGNIFVADRGNGRIQKFTSALSFVTEITLVATFSIDIDNQNNVWTVDGDGPNKFSNSGSFITQFTDTGGAISLSNPPFGIAVNNLGNVYIADTDFTRNRVMIWDSAGNLISRFGEESIFLSSTVTSPQSVFVDNLGHVYVVGSDYYKKFSDTDNFVMQFGSFGSGPGQFNSPNGMFVDSVGNIYVADGFNPRIQKFNSAGIFQLEIALSSADVVVSTSGNIYADDVSNNSVKIFDSSGSLILDLNTVLSGPDQIVGASGLGIDSANNVYIADGGDCTVKKISPSDTLLLKFGSCGSLDGEFQSLGDVAVDSSGDIWTVENSSPPRLQKFDSSGMHLLSFGDSGKDPGQFGDPRQIATDSLDNLYVIDVSNEDVQKFDSSGNFLFSFSGVGTVNGAINDPAGLAVDSSGKIYVANRDEVRIYSQPALCAPPGSGPWNVAVTCTMTATATAPEDVIVPNGIVLTIPNGITLNINFTSFNLTVESGGGVLIEVGGKIT